MGKKRFNEHPFSYHQEIELEISTLTNLGVGLGRVQIPEAAAVSAPIATNSAEQVDPSTRPPREGGWVVMCAFTLPGERVRARVFRNHKNYSEADLIAVLRPSPHRIKAPCPVFGRCGGCQYQNFEYEQQLLWKRQHVEELLAHMAELTFPVSPVIGSPQQYGYRSKITPHFNPPKPLAPDEANTPEAEKIRFDERHFPIGFLRQGNRFDLVDVPRCEIATEAINAKLPEVRAQTRQRAAEGAFARGATLLMRDALGGVTTSYDEIITERVGDLKLRFLARDFFQNNPFILSAFTSYVRAQAVASGAKFLVDAYCGSGLFALTAAPAFEKVTGVEISATSVNFARENAQANGVVNATFEAGDASAIFAGLAFPAAETVVVIDPPRKGCDESFLSQLFQYGPRAVVYVSCDPATQMRDLVQFQAQGYTLTAVQPFDLFPQTRHLECVITLKRKSTVAPAV